MHVVSAADIITSTSPAAVASSPAPKRRGRQAAATVAKSPEAKRVKRLLTASSPDVEVILKPAAAAGGRKRKMVDAASPVASKKTKKPDIEVILEVPAVTGAGRRGAKTTQVSVETDLRTEKPTAVKSPAKKLTRGKSAKETVASPKGGNGKAKKSKVVSPVKVMATRNRRGK